MKGAVHTGWMLFWEATMKINVLGTEVDVTRETLMRQNIAGPAHVWEARCQKVFRDLKLSVTDAVHYAVDICCAKRDKRYRLKRRHQIMRAYTSTMKFHNPDIMGPLRRLVAVLEGLLGMLVGVAGNTVHV
jgi:hypothetical protein